MKKNYMLSLSVMIFLSGSTFAQVNKLEKPEDPHQKTLRLENNATREIAIDGFGKLYKLGKENTFIPQKENSDISGMIHQRNQQYYKGIKVEFGTAITHSRDGEVVSVNGELYNPGDLSITPSLSAENCLARAMSYMPSTSKFLWEDKDQAALMDYKKPTGDLVILPLIQTGEIKLAYKYDIYTSMPIAREEVYVDAHTGALLYRNPLIKHANGFVSKAESDKITKQVEKIAIGSNAADASKVVFATGSAATRYSGNRNIETTYDSSTSKYVLNDAIRGNGIVTYNSANTATYPSTNFTDADNNWSDGNYTAASSTKDNAALDAHWGAEMTYDFWKNIFNRNSFDDAGAQIKSYVHFNLVAYGQPSNDNAFWNGSVMTYGDGSTLNVLTSLDICGHEIGHGVCSHTANLAYQNQSGAMNEGLSDIWGTCIEQYGKIGNLNAPADTASPGSLALWKIGEDVYNGNSFRSMSYPTTKNCPDTFLGTYYKDTQDDTGASGTACTSPSQQTNDLCGVHTNSGVLNHWFYILTAGKSGTNNASAANGGPDVYNVAGIGMAKAAQITFYAERDYLTANAKFTDARDATIAVAGNLYCGSSPEVQAVTKAWFAVNVGADFTGVANDIATKSIAGLSNSVSCSGSSNPSVIIENAGTGTITDATITWNVDGGANSTINWTGSLASCSTANQAITLPALTRGYHTLNVTTTMTGDGNATNASKSMAFTVNNAGTVAVVNPFTNASDALVSVDANGTSNTVWERGTLATKTNLTNTLAGSAVYATKLTGKYPDNTTSYLVSQCYNLTNVNNAAVKFDMAYDLETNYDSLIFEYSVDNGATWSVLGTAADATWYNSSLTYDGTSTGCATCVGKQWTGQWASTTSGAVNPATKRNYSHSLTQFGNGGATPASNIIFRFKFASDPSANFDGVIIDNFVIDGVLSTVQNQFETFGVYPNPSNGVFNVVLSTSEKVNVSLYDLRGRSIYNDSFANTGSVFNKELNFSTLSSGVYILNVESAGKKASKRIIIE